MSMEDLLGQLKGHTDTVRMTADEKSAMRSRLSEYMALRPVRSVAPMRHGTAKTRMISNLFARPMPILAAILSLMLAGGGVSYAAEGAMPGDTLYPVKVRVNEEVRAALTLDAEAKAQWETARAERRLNETRALLEADAATPELLDKLEARFDAHEERIESVITKIEEKKGPEVAARISSQLEASLAAHKAILEKLSAGVDVDVKAEFDAAFAAEGIVAKVGQASERAKEVRERTEKDVHDEQAARRAAALANVKLRVAADMEAKFFARLGGETGGIGERVLLGLQESIAAAKRFIAVGDGAMEDGAFNDAFRAYNEAIRELRGAEIFAEGGHVVAAVKKEVVVEDEQEEKARIEVKVKDGDDQAAVKLPVKLPVKDVVVDVDVAARYRADGKRVVAVSESEKLRARIDGYAREGHTWTAGKDAHTAALGIIAQGDAQFAAKKFDAAFESFYQAYSKANGALGMYVYAPKEESVKDTSSVDADARARAEMKRGYAMDAIANYEKTIAYKIDAVGENHEFVIALRVNLASAEDFVAEGDAKFSAGSYDAAYESYLAVWSVLK